MEPLRPKLDLGKLVRSGVSACVHGFTKAKMKNFTLDAFATWAERMHGSKAADSWDKIFPRGKHLLTGLRSIQQYVDYYYTGGGLCRPLFAEFLAEAGAALNDQTLTRASERYAELGRDWSALADAALPEGMPGFRKPREMLARISELYHSEGAAAAEEIRQGWVELEASGTGVGEDFPLGVAECDTLLRDLQARVKNLHRAEVDALALLEAGAT